jgi:hypothetical protein
MQFFTMASQPTGKVLDVPNGTSDHVPIQQFRNNNGAGQLGSSNQQWIFHSPPHDGDLEVGSHIVSRATGQALEVPFDDFRNGIKPLHIFQSFVPPASIKQNQTWSRFSNDDGSVSIFSMLANRDVPNPQALDVPADHLQDDGTLVQLFPFHGGPVQRWNLSSVFIRVHLIVAARDSSVLDVPGFTHDDSFVQHNAANSGTNQLWIIDPPVGTAGFHTITSVCSDKVLQIADDGSLMQAAPAPDSQNQQWLLITTGADANFLIQNRTSGQALDSSLDAVRVFQTFPAVGQNQEWSAREVAFLYAVP